MNCEKCNSVISEGQNFCPKCGADFRRMEKKVCPNCNFHLAENVLFCSNCGQKIQIDQECKEAEAFVKAKNNKRLVKILTSCIIGVLIIIAIVYACMQNTVEKKLTKHEWWEEEMSVYAQPTYGEMYDYYVTFTYRCYTFYPSGAQRVDYFTEGTELDDYSNRKYISFDSIDSYRSEDQWELLDDNRLYYGGLYYEWNRREGKFTWYVDNDELRIGEDCFYKKAAIRVTEDSDNKDIIPYWCSYCGKLGPYNGVCPKCGGKDKSECYW